jgi:ribosome biogenesis GTPase
VGEVSGRLQRGRHTTRHVELFPLAPGALVADSPGFNRPALPSDPAALALLFPEMRHRLTAASCRFSNCLHQGDPGCAIGTGWDREDLYGQCLADLLAEAAREERRINSGPGLRQRGTRLEPRLDPRLRQESRRRQRQQAQHEEPLDELSPPGPAG